MGLEISIYQKNVTIIDVKDIPMFSKESSYTIYHFVCVNKKLNI